VSDYETTQRRRDIVVGIFVVAGVCALVWLIFKFGDLPILASRLGSFRVYVQFATAPGVQKDTPVSFCGYHIGRVTNVMAPEILEDQNTHKKYYQTKVVLSIDRKYKNIPSNVAVKLMKRGLGSSYIELKVNPAALPAPPRVANRPETRFLVDGMLLQGSTGMTSEFFPEESQKKLDELVDSLKQLINNTNEIVGDPNNKENLRATLAELPHTTKQAEQTLKEFQRLAATANTTLKDADAKIGDIVAAMVDTSAEVSKTVSQLRVLLEKVNNGKGSAGKIVNSGRLYENVLESTEQLQMLMHETRSLIKKLKEIMEKVNKKGLRSIY